MAYADLPSFYPSGWFWLGGRFANLAGLEGWAAFKPWSILSLGVAAALVTVLWTRLLRTDLGAVVGLVSTAMMLTYGSPEPYGAVVALFIPPVLILAWHAVNPTVTGHSAEETGHTAATGHTADATDSLPGPLARLAASAPRSPPCCSRRLRQHIHSTRVWPPARSCSLPRSPRCSRCADGPPTRRGCPRRAWRRSASARSRSHSSCGRPTWWPRSAALPPTREPPCTTCPTPARGCHCP